MYSGWISSGPGAFPAFRVLRAVVISAGVNAWQSWSSTEGVPLFSEPFLYFSREGFIVVFEFSVVYECSRHF